MCTDEDKARLAKLLDSVEVPDVKLTERCSDLVRGFHERFEKEVEEEGKAYEEAMESEPLDDNPYKVDSGLLKENERKLKELLDECKRIKKEFKESIITNQVDPKRPWRTHSSKERLLRINNELKQHHERGSQVVTPLTEDDMKQLVKECETETRNAPQVPLDRLKSSGQHIPRPDSRQCFLRSLGELSNLRVLALEYSHIADSTGGALISLLPLLKRPHFRLQLICREDQTPRYVDPSLGVGGHDVPDEAWRRVMVACPDLYVLMTFYRIRDYDIVKRFLTPSIPLRETHLELGIDLHRGQRQDSDLSCFIRHISFCYADTMMTLSLHQWRAASVPFCAIFELLPRLGRFFYIGIVHDVRDLRRMMEILACGVCERLKQVHIQIQDEESTRDYWRQVITRIREEFDEVIKLFGVNFCLDIYRI